MRLMMPNANDTTEGVVLSGVVIVVAAVTGLVIGLIIEGVSRRKGRPTAARRVLRIAEHSIQGFALGSLTADFLSNLIQNGD